MRGVRENTVQVFISYFNLGIPTTGIHLNDSKKRTGNEKRRKYPHLRPRAMIAGHNGVDHWQSRRFWTAAAVRRENTPTTMSCRCRHACIILYCIPLPGSRYPGNGTVGVHYMVNSNTVVVTGRPVTGYFEKKKMK